MLLVRAKKQTNPLSVLFYIYLEWVSVCWTAQSLCEQEWDAENIPLIAWLLQMVVVEEESCTALCKGPGFNQQGFFTFSQHCVPCFNIPHLPPVHSSGFCFFWKEVKNIATSSTSVLKLFPLPPFSFQLVVCKGICVCSYYGTLFWGEVLVLCIQNVQKKSLLKNTLVTWSADHVLHWEISFWSLRYPISWIRTNFLYWGGCFTSSFVDSTLGKKVVELRYDAVWYLEFWLPLELCSFEYLKPNYSAGQAVLWQLQRALLKLASWHSLKLLLIFLSMAWWVNFALQRAKRFAKSR